MLFLIVLCVLLLAVAIFALENGQPVTVRFLSWQLQSSVAIVTLVATAVGVLVAGLIGLVSRLRRWKGGRAATDPSHLATLPIEPRLSGAKGIESATGNQSAGPARRDPSGSLIGPGPIR